MLLGKRAIVLGGAGQLGQSVISKFVRNGWKTISVDYLVNEESSGSIEIPEGKPQYFKFIFFSKTYVVSKKKKRPLIYFQLKEMTGYKKQVI